MQADVLLEPSPTSDQHRVELEKKTSKPALYWYSFSNKFTPPNRATPDELMGVNYVKITTISLL